MDVPEVALPAGTCIRERPVERQEANWSDRVHGGCAVVDYANARRKRNEFVSNESLGADGREASFARGAESAELSSVLETFDYEVKFVPAPVSRARLRERTRVLIVPPAGRSPAHRKSSRRKCCATWARAVRWSSTAGRIG